MSFRGALRRLLERVAPRSTAAVRAARSRRHAHRLVRDWNLCEIDDRLVQRFGPVVRAGPFAGLRLPPVARSIHLGPFLLGTYEDELHPWLEEVRTLPIVRVIDVGAGFGYYAVGLARWFPSAQVLAFDTDPWARRALASTARANEVHNLSVLGLVRPDELAAQLLPRSLVISDCEGYEDSLLDSHAREALRECWVIVELHEDVVPGVESRLRERFESSHAIRSVDRRSKTPTPDIEALLGIDDAARAVNEIRGDQRWLFLTPK